MGELFAGPGYRTCSHPACKWPATTTLGFDYASKLSWLEDLAHRRDPSTYELCSIHAERFRPPKGWLCQDRRTMPEPLFSLEMSLSEAGARNVEAGPTEIDGPPPDGQDKRETALAPSEKSVAVGGSDFTFTSGPSDSQFQVKKPASEASPRRSGQLFP